MTTETGKPAEVTETNTATAAAPEITTTTTTETTDKTTPNTVLDSKVADDKQVTPPSDWPEDWREKYAGTDAKKIDQLKRFSTPKAALDAYFEASKRISAGQLKPVLADNPTPEDLAAFRAANEIPEKPDGYNIKLNDGYVVGDADKPYINKFLESMHSKNATPGQVNDVLNTYYQIAEQQEMARQESDTQAKMQTEDALRKEWGTDYRRNINIIKGFVENRYGDAASLVLNGRLADGTPIFSNPAVLDKFLNLALEVDPTSTVLPGVGLHRIDSIQTEIETIEKVLKTDSKTYFADAKMQERYRQLITAKLKLGTAA